MSAAVLSLGAHWLAALLLAAALGAGLGVALARSLFAMCMSLAACGALVASAVLLLVGGDAGLGLALLGATWAPLLLLGAMLLSARAVKPLKRGRPWLSIAAASATGLAMLWASSEFGAFSHAAPSTTAPLGPWPAVLMLVASAACVGLLGYGERGALGGAEQGT